MRPLRRVPLAPIQLLWRQFGATLVGVPSVQIKNVPPDVHQVLRRRAAAAGQSLQEYLLARLSDEARQPSVDEVLARAGSRAGGSLSLSFASQSLRDERERR